MSCTYLGTEWMIKRSPIFVSWQVLVGSLFGAGALAKEGVSQDKIVFGQVAALDGPAQALGKGMREGILAAFEEVNRTGGSRAASSS
jgi:ABC-type branched-subunit amino acid transport system substrate-binding protein